MNSSPERLCLISHWNRSLVISCWAMANLRWGSPKWYLVEGPGSVSAEDVGVELSCSVNSFSEWHLLNLSPTYSTSNRRSQKALFLCPFCGFCKRRTNIEIDIHCHEHFGRRYPFLCKDKKGWQITIHQFFFCHSRKHVVAAVILLDLIMI